MPGIKLERLPVIMASWMFSWAVSVGVGFALDEPLSLAQLYEQNTEY